MEINKAIAYIPKFYLDNQEEIDSYIERNKVPDELVHPLVKAALDKSQ